VSTGRFANFINLAVGEESILAGAEFITSYRPNRHTPETLYRMPSSIEQLTNFVCPTLAHRDAPPGVPSTFGRSLAAGAQRTHVVSADKRSTHELAVFGVCEITPDLDQVLSNDTKTGMAQPFRQLAIVCENDETFRVVIEPTDRVNAFLDCRSHQIDHGGALLRIIARGHDLPRLVQQKVAQRFRCPKSLAVYLDVVSPGVGPLTHLRDSAVDRDTTLFDHSVSLAPGTEPGPGDEFLESFFCHHSLLSGCAASRREQ
jgi:hypothetical protein